MFGGALLIEYMDNTILKRCTLVNNTADYGGAAFVPYRSRHNLQLMDVSAMGNHANEAGGVLFLVDSELHNQYWTQEAPCSLGNGSFGNTASKWGHEVATAPTKAVLQDLYGRPISAATFTVTSGQYLPPRSLKAQFMDSCDNIVMSWKLDIFHAVRRAFLASLLSIGLCPDVCL